MAQSQAAIRHPPPLLFFDDEDDGFGDFKFAASAPPPPPPQPLPDRSPDDDEWGEFVATPLCFEPSPSDPFYDASLSSPDLVVHPDAAPPAAGGKWEKPTGALPLSIFGDEEVEEPESLQSPSLFANHGLTSSAAPSGKDRAGLGSLKDLISTLYGQDGAGAGDLDGGPGDFDEDSWDFKQASTLETGVKQKEEICMETSSNLKEDAAGNDGGIQATKNTWEDNISDVPISYNHNGKVDFGGHFLNNNGIASDPDSMRDAIKSIDLCTDVVLNDVTSILHNSSENGHIVYPLQQSVDNRQNSRESTPNSVVMNNGNDADEFEWEFQMASEETFATHDTLLKPDQNVLTELTQNSTTNTERSPDSVIMNVLNDSDDFNWEFQMNSEDKFTNHSFVLKKDQSPMESSYNNLLHVCSRLKEASLRLVAHQLVDCKEVAALSGEQARTIEFNEEIQEAHKKLQEESVVSGEHPSKDLYVSQLFEVIREPCFQPFEQEYGLSELISSLEQNLSAAIILFEHATSIHHILALASQEEQRSYVRTWSKIAQACSQELELGVKIWKESVDSNVCRQILSQGKVYFIALGEIYHVSEILRASLKLYKPWILANQLDSKNMLAFLDKCAEAWMTYGLEKSLDIMVSAIDLECSGMITVLLEAIRIARDLDDLSLLFHPSRHEKIVCRMSLLPMGVLQDMKTAVWNGEHYFLKFANFWANCVSRDPPQLPEIHIS